VFCVKPHSLVESYSTWREFDLFLVWYTCLNWWDFTLIIGYCADAPWARHAIFQECVTSYKRVRVRGSLDQIEFNFVKDTIMKMTLENMFSWQSWTSFKGSAFNSDLHGWKLFYWVDESWGEMRISWTPYLKTILLVIHACWSAFDKRNFPCGECDQHLLWVSGGNKAGSQFYYWAEESGLNNYASWYIKYFTSPALCLYNPPSFTCGDISFTVSLISYYSLFR